MSTSRTSEASTPGDGLLHPVVWISVGLLLVNDHCLKHAFPGWLTGKLSDVAGMMFFPLFLQAIVELGRRSLRLPSPPSRRLLTACTAVTILVFAAIKLWVPAALVYRYGLGWLQFPFRWAFAGALRPRVVHLVQDPSDLLAVPFSLLAFATGARRARKNYGAQRRSPRAPLAPFVDDAILGDVVKGVPF